MAMKFKRLFLCDSFLDLADVTHSLTLSDQISIFNSNNRATSAFSVSETPGQFF